MSPILSQYGLPLYKLIVVYGLVVLLHSQLSNGAAVVVQPSFTPDGFVKDIHKYYPNYIR